LDTINTLRIIDKMAPVLRQLRNHQLL